MNFTKAITIFISCIFSRARGRDLFAAVRSIVNTGKRQGFSAFESILIALNPLKSLLAIG